MIFKDYGKQAYTFYARKNGQGIRVVLNQAAIPEDLRADRTAFIEWLLVADEAEIISLQPVTIDEPERARVMASVVCETCGEAAMETRIKLQQGKNICIPCSEKNA